MKHQDFYAPRARAAAVSAFLCTLTLGACASSPAPSDAAAAPATATAAPADGLSLQDRIDFFVSDARNGKIDAVKQGLDAGLSVNAQDSLNQTPLLAAITHDALDEVKLLLARGADPNLPDNAGWTPLHYAAYFGSSVLVMTALLDHGAKIDAQNDRGVTPLYFASATGHEYQVQLLLARGADRNIASKSGYTPLRIAKTKGLGRIVAMLDPDAAKAASEGAATAPPQVH